jgi:hypothetical protein
MATLSLDGEESLPEAGDKYRKKIPDRRAGCSFEHVIELTYKLPIRPWYKSACLQEIGR